MTSATMEDVDDLTVEEMRHEIEAERERQGEIREELEPLREEHGEAHDERAHLRDRDPEAAEEAHDRVRELADEIGELEDALRRSEVRVKDLEAAIEDKRQEKREARSRGLKSGQSRRASAMDEHIDALADAVQSYVRSERELGRLGDGRRVGTVITKIRTYIQSRICPAEDRIRNWTSERIPPAVRDAESVAELLGHDGE